jgi:hypothetical protein
MVKNKKSSFSSTSRHHNPTMVPKRQQQWQKDGLAGNRTLDHSQAVSRSLIHWKAMLSEYYTTKPQALSQATA